MILYTYIARLSDSLALCSSVETDDLAASVKSQKSQINTLLNTVNEYSEPRYSIVSGEYNINYLIDDGIIYFCITELKFPRTLAFAYLQELQKEFSTSHGSEALQPNVRPYQFAGFDTFIQKTKLLHQDQRAAMNLTQMNADLQDVSKIMSKNIEDLVYRGEKLDRITDLSTSLKYESKKYRKAAKRVNLEALFKQYAPFGAVGLIVLFLIWWRFF